MYYDSVAIHEELCREMKEQWIPFDSTPYCSTAAFDAAFPILHEIVASLQSLNIVVEQVGRNSCYYLYQLSVIRLIFSLNGELDFGGTCHRTWKSHTSKDSH